MHAMEVLLGEMIILDSRNKVEVGIVCRDYDDVCLLEHSCQR